MHTIESELIKATSYKARKKFDNRQDYLGSIMNAVIKLNDDEFSDLSDDAANWTDAAIMAHNAKSDIPDFDEVEADADAVDETTDEGHEDDDSPDEGVDAEDADEDEDVVEDDPGEDDEATAEDDANVSEPDDDAPDEVEEKPAKKATKAAKKVAKPTKEAKKPEQLSMALSKPLKRQGPHDKRVDRDEDVVLDKYGCMEGSKNSNALKLFEKGATAKEIKEKLGGTYYNILKKQQKLGHLVEKEGAIIKLTHREAGKPQKTVIKKPKK